MSSLQRVSHCLLFAIGVLFGLLYLMEPTDVEGASRVIFRTAELKVSRLFLNRLLKFDIVFQRLLLVLTIDRRIIQ